MQLYSLFYFLRVKLSNRLIYPIRKVFYLCQGMQIGKQTQIPKIYVTWPHQVSIGQNCKLEKGIIFNFDGINQPGPKIIIGNNTFLGNSIEFNIQKGLVIGNNSLIASGVKIIDHDHGTRKNLEIKKQTSNKSAIQIGNDVWIGSNSILLMGSMIEDGAIVAAGSVVKTRVPKMEIWGGVPAKKISDRV